jgi:hypothetical protein
MSLFVRKFMNLWIQSAYLICSTSFLNSAYTHLLVNFGKVKKYLFSILIKRGLKVKLFIYIMRVTQTYKEWITDKYFFYQTLISTCVKLKHLIGLLVIFLVWNPTNHLTDFKWRPRSHVWISDEKSENL